jgi:hypothetical protein
MEKKNMSNINNEISIRWDGRTASQLEQSLSPHLSVDDVKLEVRDLEGQGAITDPTILVAIIGGTSAALTALLSGLLQLIHEKKQTIVLQAANGRKMEIPANTSKEKIEELLKLLKEIERIRIVER